MQANNGNMYLLDNTPGAVAYPWPSNTPPLILRSELDGGQDWARFADQVRANEYCDHSGNNCISTAGCTEGQVLTFQGRTIGCADAVTPSPGATIVRLSRSEIEDLLRPQIEADLGVGTGIDGIYALGAEGARACEAYAVSQGRSAADVTLHDQDSGDFDEPDDNDITFLNPSGAWETMVAGRNYTCWDSPINGDPNHTQLLCGYPYNENPYVEGQTINRFLRWVECLL